LKECPITAEQGKIEIAEILVIDWKNTWQTDLNVL
jgi:hypothetical protein